MMANWRIKAIPLGANFIMKEAITVGLDTGLQIWFPYLVFFLTDGKRNILVDTGISEDWIVDGKAWGGFPAYGGTEHALKEFDKAKVDIQKVEMVLYTHLHNDHTGCSRLFDRAVHVFQWDEWQELINPLPSMKLRRDYNPGIIPVLEKLDCWKIEGDLRVTDGITLYKTPGHTAGGMCIGVDTAKGTHLLTGDTAHTYQNLFSQCSEMTILSGEKIKITPASPIYGPFVPSSLVYDHYAWYRSMYRIRAICPSMELALPSHEPTIAGRTFPG